MGGLKKAWRSVRKFEKRHTGVAGEKLRSKWGLTGDKIKKHLNLGKYALGTSSSASVGSGSYQYNSARTISQLTGGV